MKTFTNKLIYVNTFKITLATILAIFISEELSLQNSISAGIVAILSIAPTKKETIKTASIRFYGFVIALIIGFLCYTVMGYNLPAFCAYIGIYIFVCQKRQWYSAMAMNSVLISHFIGMGIMNRATIMNEILLFVIGVGCGILVNLHLVKRGDYIKVMINETDERMQYALLRMSYRLLDQNLPAYTGECFKELNKSIYNAKTMAQENYMNQFGISDTYDIEYISMREQQIHILYNMYQRVCLIHTTPVTAQHVSDYLKYLSINYNKNNSIDDMLNEFQILNQEMTIMPLPKERKEFEDRAHLYTLMREIEKLLLIKKEFVK